MKQTLQSVCFLLYSAFFSLNKNSVQDVVVGEHVYVCHPIEGAFDKSVFAVQKHNTVSLMLQAKIIKFELTDSSKRPTRRKLVVNVVLITIAISIANILVAVPELNRT